MRNTEKILHNNNVFETQKNDAAPDNTAETYLPYSPDNTIHTSTRFSFKNIFSFRKPVTIGVDICSQHLILIKVKHDSEQKKEVLDYLVESEYSFHSKSETDINSEHLKSVLTKFCNSSPSPQIWTVLSTPDFRARYIQIPKISARQIFNAVYWKYKREVPFDENESIFNFEILGEIIENGIKKTEVIAFTIPKKEVESLKIRFSKIGFPLTGIIACPLGLQNLFRNQWLNVEEKHICSLYVGSGWSHIDIFFPNGNLALSRTIRTGIHSMIEILQEHGIQSIEYKMSDFEDREIFNKILPAVNRLANQVERTLEHYSQTFNNEKVEKIYISGPISICQRFADYMGEYLDFHAECANPFTSMPHSPANISFSESISEKKTEKRVLTLAMSLALADKFTPNFIFTYKYKRKLSNITLINRSILTVSLILIILCMGSYYWQKQLFRQKGILINNFHTELNRNMLINRDMLEQKIKQLKSTTQILKSAGSKYLVIAVIQEISELTPPYIRLIELFAELGGIEQIKNTERKITLKGIVLEDQEDADTNLNSYLAQLESSLIFDQYIVRDKSVKYFQGQEVLYFNITIGIDIDKEK